MQQCQIQSQQKAFHLYVPMKGWKKVAAFLEGKKVPNVTGRTWTTDAVYRETSGKAEKLREDGCIAVEMELAGMQAVCEYYGFALKAFLFASDCLGTEEWHNELLGSAACSHSKCCKAHSITLYEKVTTHTSHIFLCFP